MKSETIASAYDVANSVAWKVRRNKFGVRVYYFLEDPPPTLNSKIHIGATHGAPIGFKYLQGVVHSISCENCFFPRAR